ncbi:MAG TPA: ABC transporter ATP-binding protein [bacterium]|nr:ABC transporter ATP-binding protein [bacterium]
MIEIQDVYKTFNGVPVLKGLNLTIRDGETMVIIGRSGCGKSVLLKHMIGLLKPDAGRILVDGVDIAALGPRELMEIRKKFGMLFQGAALFDSMTVAENVGFALYEHTRMTDQEIRERVTLYLSMVGMEGIEDKKPAELSGGMRKRVGLARAIAIGPQIILYDEPTTGIDPIMGDIINDLILKMRDTLSVSGCAVTHDMTSAYKIADRIAMMYDGRIVQIGSPDEIKNSTNPIVRQFISGSSKGPIKILDD